MFVHMLVRDVRNDSYVKFASIYAALRPTMRSGLQDNMCQTSLHHLCQITLYIVGIWCGDMESSVQHFISDDCIYRGDHSCFKTRRDKDFVKQITRCRFAIGTCHADDRQLTGGKGMKRRSKPGQGMTRVLQLNIWDAKCIQVSISNNRSGTIVNCFLNVVVTICITSSHGNK